MSSKTPFAVRSLLMLVRFLMRLKRLFLKGARRLGRWSRPLSRLLLSGAVPIYGLFLRLQRRLGAWYRPAKNRFLFLLSNKGTLPVVTFGIAAVAIGVNMRFPVARAESVSFGERTLLYALVTGERNEVIEEYADTTMAFQETDNIQSFSLRPAKSANLLTTTTETDALAASPVPIETPAAPRSETIAYKVEDGDTLSTISEKFGISLNTLLWANKLTARSVIRPGDTLSILPVSGVEHGVARGDTLIAIAKKYGVDATAIAEQNSLTTDATLSVGAKLVIPGGVLRAPAVVARPVAVRDIFTPAPAGSQGETAPKEGATMVWPTTLRTHVRGLSWYHTGVDIDCNGHADGTSTNDNYAAADGTIRFAGWRKGYGNTVEIDHGDGIVTRYGHFHSIYVSSGDPVSAGAALGRCGSTGNSSGTHLHFEVIINGKFKNPYDYIK